VELSISIWRQNTLEECEGVVSGWRQKGEGGVYCTSDLVR
jgi:hypothetical protein